MKAIARQASPFIEDVLKWFSALLCDHTGKADIYRDHVTNISFQGKFGNYMYRFLLFDKQLAVLPTCKTQ